MLKEQWRGKLDCLFPLEKCGHLNQDAGNRLPFFPSLYPGVDELLGQTFQHFSLGWIQILGILKDFFGLG